VARRAAELERVAASADRVATVAGDVTDPRTAQRAVVAAEALGGGVDILVNNAGLDHTGDLLEVPEDEVRRTLEVNFFGALWMLQHAGRAMSESPAGGAIVNVTSRLASVGVPTMGIYGASKGALLALTRHAAVELADKGIRVNAVAPGFTDTSLFREWLAEQRDPVAARVAAEEAIPQRRLGTPEEVAAAVAFLASAEAAHVTGSSIAVDGGFTAA
jgi:NAD(P)-dependent dehydrogenase (short-subunit alcohol dehydrogenase family)